MNKAEFELRRKKYDKTCTLKSERYDRKVSARSDLFDRKKQAKIGKEHGKWGRRMAGFGAVMAKRRPDLRALEPDIPGGRTEVRHGYEPKPIHGVSVKIIGINKPVHGVGGNRTSKKREITGGVEGRRLSFQDERMKRTRETEKMRREVESARLQRQRGIAGERGEAGLTWREKKEMEHEKRAEEEAERVREQKAGEHDRSLAWVSRSF